MKTPSERRHDTVGRVFKAFGAKWRCIRWVRASGFDMQMIDGVDGLVGRPIGHVTNISERAIGATYRDDWRDESYTEHVQPCNCWVCEGRESS